MRRWTRAAMVALSLLAAGMLAMTVSVINRRTGGLGEEATQGSRFRCALDGTKINPLYEVDAFLDDGTSLRFSSIESARRWLKMNQEHKVRYFTAVDEVSGQRLDASLLHYVVSDVVTVPEVHNRIHAFSSREDALTHARQFDGRLIDNPLGGQFSIPKAARLDMLSVAAPSLPDALPIRLALARPIFKENRLDVTVIPVAQPPERERFDGDRSASALVCDLPDAILFTQRCPSARIVRNMLRANPFRPLFAVVATAEESVRDLEDLRGKAVAVPKGVAFQYYLDFFLQRAGLPSDHVTRREVLTLEAAWEMLHTRKVTAAILRTPYTDLAAKRGMLTLADDCTLPWMSVLVVKDAADPGKLDVTRRFVFSLEQAVLALNLKPDEFRAVLTNGAGIPPEVQKSFPMPIFEGSNAPSPDEVKPVIDWLVEKKLLRTARSYEQVVDTRLLPDPQSVGLAFCCR